MMVQRRTLAYSALLLAVFIWGISFVVVKEGIKAWEGQEFTFLAARFWLACLVYGIYLTARHGLSKRAFSMSVSMIFRASLVGLILAVGFILQTWYLVEGSAVRAAFLTSTTVLWAPIIALLLRQRVHLATIFGAAVAMTGVVVLEWKNITLNSDLTNWFALFAAIAFALEILLVSRYVPKEKSLQWTMVSCLSVALSMTILALLREPWHWSAGQTAKRSVAVIFMGIFATGVAIGLQNWAQAQEINSVRIIDGPRAAIIATLEPVFTTLLAGTLILLGLQMRDQSDLILPAIGCCLILTGTLISEITAAFRALKQHRTEQNA